MKPHVMLDIEATDNDPSTAAVLSIAAVAFCREGIIDKPVFWRTRITDQMKVGRTVGESTMEWWFGGQPSSPNYEGAQRAWLGAKVGYTDAYHQLCDFIERIRKDNGEQPCVWGNGSDYDQVCLRSTARAFGINRTWPFTANRCFRTVKNLYDPSKELWTAPVVAHDPIDDCISQISHFDAIANKYGIHDFLYGAE